MASLRERMYTIEDIYALPDGQRAELIDGYLYNMAFPNRIHQRISHILEWTIENHIQNKKGSCQVYAAPFSVFLNRDDRNYVEPDISVICDKDKLNDKGCTGAPDWIIEITSPPNPETDYGIKLYKYRTAGVREYWIVNPQQRSVIVYDFEQEKRTNHYAFEDTVPGCIYEDLTICLADLLNM